MAEASTGQSRNKEKQQSHPVSSVQETTCCVVGAGPAGVILSLLLARRNIPVILLEAHDDFDRDFRGDTLHPSAMEIIDQLGLADRLLKLRHSKIHQASFMTPNGPVILADFRRLKTKFPYIAMLPQAQFLEFMTEEAKRYTSFQIVMGASAQELIKEDGQIRGVRYRRDNEWHEVRAPLTVGADGRSSRMRRLGDFEMIKTSPPMDVLWFRLPREADEPEGVLARFGRGHILIMLDRLDQWQIGYVILKGSYQQIHEAGLEALRQSIALMAPELKDRVERLQDWKQIAVLSVESSRVKRWYKPGLLLIGDAAHVMSPVAGVGINYAIQDAVVAYNVLAEPLRKEHVQVSDLRRVQDKREWPTRLIQAFQAFAQRAVIASALRSNRPLQFPLLLRLLLRVPLLRDLPARLIAFGVRRVRVKD